MPAPEWIQTQAGDLVNVSQINSIRVVDRNTVKLDFMNGTSLNYQFSDATEAADWFAAYETVIGPSAV